MNFIYSSILSLKMTDFFEKDSKEFLHFNS